MIQESDNHQIINSKLKSSLCEINQGQYHEPKQTFLCSDNFQFKQFTSLQQNPLIQINTIKIGKVQFSLSKSNKKSNLAKLLLNFYDQQYIQKYHEGLRKKALINGTGTHLSEENQTQSNQLTLQAVKIYHYHAVLSTDQQKFCLRKTQYKQSRTTFGLQILWGIQFHSLKKLDLSSQKISSIEGLSFVDMPNLVKLSLHDNKIHNLNILSKFTFKQCKFISFFDNPITSTNLTNRMNFPALQRTIIDQFQLMSRTRQNVDKKITSKRLQNIDFIFKFQNLSNIKQVRLVQKNRIFPQKLKQKLLEINPNIKFKVNDRNEDIFQRLQQLNQVGQQNNPVQFRRFINMRIQPLLRERLANNQINNTIVTQIRARIFEQLQLLQQRFRNRQGV